MGCRSAGERTLVLGAVVLAEVIGARALAGAGPLG